MTVESNSDQATAECLDSQEGELSALLQRVMQVPLEPLQLKLNDLYRETSNVNKVCNDIGVEQLPYIITRISTIDNIIKKVKEHDYRFDELSDFVSAKFLEFNVTLGVITESQADARQQLYSILSLSSNISSTLESTEQEHNVLINQITSRLSTLEAIFNEFVLAARRDNDLILEGHATTKLQVLDNNARITDAHIKTEHSLGAIHDFLASLSSRLDILEANVRIDFSRISADIEQRSECRQAESESNRAKDATAQAARLDSIEQQIRTIQQRALWFGAVIALSSAATLALILSKTFIP